MAHEIKRIAQRSLRRVGLEVRRARRAPEAPKHSLFNADAWNRNARDDRHLVAMLAAVLRSDSNCVDVGAHLGAVTEVFQRCAPHGHHIAVEPLPQFAAGLRERFPTVEVHEVALSDGPGRVPFTSVPGYEGLSGFTAPAAWPHVERVTFDVDVRTLDEIVGERCVDVVKIDVEGAELAVLRGGRRAIERHRPVIAFEHGNPIIGPSIDDDDSGELWTFLVDDHGYRIFDLDGDGPYTLEQFTEAHRTAEMFNFLATPSRPTRTVATE